MRHRKAGRKLNRDSDHRKALRRNLTADLFAHGEIVTTEAKARMIRPVAERIITIAKRGLAKGCLLYTSPSPRDGLLSRMPSSA